MLPEPCGLRMWGGWFLTVTRNIGEGRRIGTIDINYNAPFFPKENQGTVNSRRRMVTEWI